MDALQSERDQNITIDTAQIWFQTTKRQYVIIDAPGHKEFLKNMVTGAANAEAALLLIDAHEGVQENSRRHGYLLNLLGIRQIAVLVNKMDLENYSEARFNQIEAEYRAWLEIHRRRTQSLHPHRRQARRQLASRSANMPWWNGPTVLETLDEFKVAEPPDNQPLRFPIQDVYRFDDRRILAGRVEAGSPQGRRQARLLADQQDQHGQNHRTLERARAADTAAAGESIGITLTEQIFVARGADRRARNRPAVRTVQLQSPALLAGQTAVQPKARPTSSSSPPRKSSATSNPSRKSSTPPRSKPSRARRTKSFVGRHEVAELTLHTRKPHRLRYPRRHRRHRPLRHRGRLRCLRRRHHRRGQLSPPHPRLRPPRATTSTGAAARSPPASASCATATAAASSGSPACPAPANPPSPPNSSANCSTWAARSMSSTATTSATACAPTSASRPKTARENIRRVGEVAKLFADAGVICITAFISPYREDRDLVRETPAGEAASSKSYVNAPLEVCEQRDPKGLYAKARAKEIKEFTGISAPYEAAAPARKSNSAPTS